jgi:PAS domain S-box-containing protein
MRLGNVLLDDEPVFDQVGDTISLLDAAGRVLATSTPTPALGFPPWALVGSSMFDLLHEDEHEGAARLLEDLRVEGVGRIRRDFRVRDVEGLTHVLEVDAVNYLDDPGVAAVVVTTRNVTRERFAEDLLDSQQAILGSIAAGRPLESTFSEILELAESHIERSSVAVSLLSDDRTFSLVAATGLAPEVEEALRSVELDPRDDGLGALVFARQRCVTVDLGRCDDPTGVRGLLAAHGLRGFWGEPLVHPTTDRPLGVLGVFLHDAREPLSHELRAGELAAQLAAVAVEHDDRGFPARLRPAGASVTESDLRRALDERQLAVHYQPIVDLASGHICGAEALLRWTHPERGSIGPAEFIPVAEGSGLIHDLGAFVLDEALSAASGWRSACERPFLLSINVSPRQLRSGRIVGQVERALITHGWAAEQLALEITETCPLTDHTSRRVLGRLADLGVRIALDDFGTGPASLSDVHELPIDLLKVDRGFVAGLDGPPRAAAVARAVVEVADAFDLSTVAEGVETAAQLGAVRALGCERAQGYLFSRAVPAEELARLLGSGARW